jgi:hypothetical protein
MIIPVKKIHATRLGTGLLMTTRSAMMIPAISMIISPTFVALLKPFTSYTSTNFDLSLFMLPLKTKKRVMNVLINVLFDISQHFGRNSPGYYI